MPSRNLHEPFGNCDALQREQQFLAHNAVPAGILLCGNHRLTGWLGTFLDGRFPG